MILHFFGNLRTICCMNNNSAMLCAHCACFLQDRVRLRVGGRSCEPFLELGLNSEPFPLRRLCARGSRKIRTGLTTSSPPALGPALRPFGTRARLRYNSHVCRPTAASVFIYALIFFHNERTQRTLETVCVIDDKTKYSTQWFPYFWRMKESVKKK